MVDESGKPPKQVYQKPVLCPLGELAKAKGQSCGTGAVVRAASCKAGFTAKNCHVGGNDA